MYIHGAHLIFNVHSEWVYICMKSKSGVHAKHIPDICICNRLHKYVIIIFRR
jgi:hypothetical protein